MARKTTGTLARTAAGDHGPGYKFDAPTRQAILDNLRKGAFLRVAAGAAGITRQTLYEWMADKRPEYRAFQREVELAQADARFVAESAVWKNKPEVWLRTGPGRSKPDDEGWTEGYDAEGQRVDPVDAYLRSLTPEEAGGLMYALITRQLETTGQSSLAHLVEDQEELDRLSALEGLDDDDEDDDTEEQA